MTLQIIANVTLCALTILSGATIEGPDISDPPDIDNPPLRRCKPNNESLYDGYRWIADPSVCVPGLVSMKTWFTPAPPYAVGGAVFYDPHVMEATAQARGLSLDGFLDGVSLMSPSDIGRTVWLRRPGHAWEGPFLVVDSAARQDIYPVVTVRGEIVEVGFQTAARWGMIDATEIAAGEYGRPYTVNDWIVEEVEVLKMNFVPHNISDFDPVDYVQWWEGRVEFSTRYEPMPYQISPDHEDFPGWIWREGSYPDGWVYLNAYDDWFDYLFPDDPYYQFDVPQIVADRQYHARRVNFLLSRPTR